MYYLFNCVPFSHLSITRKLLIVVGHWIWTSPWSLSWILVNFEVLRVVPPFLITVLHSVVMWNVSFLYSDVQFLLLFQISVMMERRLFESNVTYSILVSFLNPHTRLKFDFQIWCWNVVIQFNRTQVGTQNLNETICNCFFLNCFCSSQFFQIKFVLNKHFQCNPVVFGVPDKLNVIKVYLTWRPSTQTNLLTLFPEFQI